MDTDSLAAKDRKGTQRILTTDDTDEQEASKGTEKQAVQRTDTDFTDGQQEAKQKLGKQKVEIGGRRSEVGK